jgi:hypothetical protein
MMAEGISGVNVSICAPDAYLAEHLPHINDVVSSSDFTIRHPFPKIKDLRAFFQRWGDSFVVWQWQGADAATNSVFRDPRGV